MANFLFFLVFVIGFGLILRGLLFWVIKKFNKEKLALDLLFGGLILALLGWFFFFFGDFRYYEGMRRNLGISAGFYSILSVYSAVYLKFIRRKR